MGGGGGGGVGIFVTYCNVFRHLYVGVCWVKEFVTTPFIVLHYFNNFV